MGDLLLKKILISITLFMLGGCTSLFFHPMKTMIRVPSDIGMLYEDVYISSVGGTTLHGWYLPATGKEKGLVTFFYGNAENISTHIASVYWLPDMGYSVLMVDYRGYGQSSGVPEIDTIHDDVYAILSYVQRKMLDGDTCHIAYGQSLGGAMLTYSLATNRSLPVSALVLDSVFSDYRTAARDVIGKNEIVKYLEFMIPVLISNRYRPDKVIANISPVPILILHSKKDEILPVHHAQELFSNAQEPKQIWLLNRGRHIHTFANDNAYMRDELIKYLDTICNE